MVGHKSKAVDPAETAVSLTLLNSWRVNMKT